jgi:hypothetical protein
VMDWLWLWVYCYSCSALKKELKNKKKEEERRQKEVFFYRCFFLLTQVVFRLTQVNPSDRDPITWRGRVSKLWSIHIVCNFWCIYEF